MSTGVSRSGWRELLGLASRRRRLLRVAGDSMIPTLPDGAVVLADPAAYRSRPPAVGDIVIALHPFRRGLVLVKRVAALDGDRLILHGDNPAEGTDSRSFGALQPDCVLGRVTSRLI